MPELIILRMMAKKLLFYWTKQGDMPRQHFMPYLLPTLKRNLLRKELLSSMLNSNESLNLLYAGVKKKFVKY